MRPIIWKGPRDLAALEQRRLGATPTSVNRWYRAWEKQDAEGLKRKAPPGYKPRLSPEQLGQLEQALLAGPAAAGYATELWTAPRVRKLGWTYQKPARRAVERDEEAIQHWIKGRWPRIKRGR